MAFSLKTAFGDLSIYSNKKAIIRIDFSACNPDAIPESIEVDCAEQLVLYFKGKLKEFSCPILPDGTEFQKSVWDKLLTIPYGSTISYRDLALRMGDVSLTRAVAQANAKNPIPILIPCHRVIGSDGSLTGYSGGIEKKRRLLEIEGVLRQITLF